MPSVPLELSRDCSRRGRAEDTVVVHEVLIWAVLEGWESLLVLVGSPSFPGSFSFPDQIHFWGPFLFQDLRSELDPFSPWIVFYSWARPVPWVLALS